MMTRVRQLPDGGHSLELRRDQDVVHQTARPDHIVDPYEMVAPTEVMFLGVSMPTGADEFKPPAVPGWRFVNATRQPFGAAGIYERVSPDASIAGPADLNVVDSGDDLAPLSAEAVGSESPKPTSSQSRIQKVCQTE